MLGAYLGNVRECSRRLLARVEKALKPLEKACRLRDTRKEKCALQVQLQINRFCGNTSLNYFLRTMGMEATRDAAARHDALIEAAFHRMVGTKLATPAERSRAVAQAWLPVKLGGLGLTPQSRVNPATCVGTWALVWRPMQQLCPQLFASVDIAASMLPALRELRAAHTDLVERYRRVAGLYDLWDSKYYDYDKNGEGMLRFHPSGLPRRDQLQPISEMSQLSPKNNQAKINKY